MEEKLTGEQFREKYPERKENAACPYCDAEIKWIKQFPLAQITSFEYMQLPTLIKGPVEDTFPLQITQGRFKKRVTQNPQISEEVIQRLAQSDEFSYQGRVYEKITIVKCGWPYVKEDFFKINPNATEEDFEKTFGKSEFEPGVRIQTDLTADVSRFLKEQEKKLKTLEGSVGKTIPTKDIFNLFSINNNYPTDLREFSFGIREYKLGECILEVESARSEADIHFGAGPGAYMIGFSLEVAKFAYNGLFREKQM